MSNVTKIYFDIPDDKKNHCGVYAIKNTRNGKIYIGSTINFRNRFKHHLSYLFNGKHNNQKLLRAYNKAGNNELVFSLVELCSIEERLTIEQKWIDFHDCVRKGYNILEKAGSNLGYKHSPSIVRRRNETRKQKGWFISDATREKRKQLMSEALTGRVFNEETLAKMKIAARKRWDIPEIREKITNSKIGKKYSDEVNKSKGRKGRVISDQTRVKMSEAQKLRIKKKKN